jgi:hypothetical protein
VQQPYALAGMAIAQGLASKESTPNKPILYASAAQYLTAPVIMLSQTNDMKPAMVAVNGIMCAGLGLLCIKAAQSK